MSIGMLPKKPRVGGMNEFFGLLGLIQDPEECAARVKELQSATARHEDVMKKAAEQDAKLTARQNSREADLKKSEQEFAGRLREVERREAEVTATEKLYTERVNAMEEIWAA